MPHRPGSLNVLLVIIFGIVLIAVCFIVRKIIQMRKLLTGHYVLLELTPPALTEKTAYTTKQLFSVLHTIGIQRTLFERLFGIKALLSFEIASTKENGIRYVVRVREDLEEAVEHAIRSYLPHVRVKKIDDYITANKSAKAIEFKLSKHFAFPLAKQDTLNVHDPVAYITGMMTKLNPGELISYQVIVSPTQVLETARISENILRNENVLRDLNKPSLPIFMQPLGWISYLMLKVIQGVSGQAVWAVNELTHGSESQTAMSNTINYQQQLSAQNIKPVRVLSTFEQQVVLSVQEKIDQDLFEATIRVLLVLDKDRDTRSRIRAVTASLAPFSVPKYQSLSRKSLLGIFDTLRIFLFKNRLLSIMNSSSSLLSVSEISDLYHFPYSRITQTENIVKVLSRELPAPLSLKQEKEKLHIIFAKNTYGGTTTMIGLPQEERRRHMYIIGATGAGKSTMILSMINQDINAGRGVAVIDPHGELAETVLQCIPEDRKDNLIYVNPDDLEYPIGINLMELTPGLSEEDSLREKEFIAESVISLFRKVFSSDMKGSPHRIEYILRNTIHTAFTVENPTLFTIYDLLNNPTYQKKIVSKLQDENLKNFWKNEFGKAGDYQKVKMVSPITARIGRFLFSPSAKRMLEQQRSTINFDEILNGKILVCNLAKGKLGEDTSQVLGIMILNKLQLASLKRARIEASARKDFYLYVDEFQHFATRSFVEMLSESRKYRLNLTIAEQSTSQQVEKDLVHIILANVGTVVCFKTANPEDEKLLLPQFEPYIAQGEIYNLPAFHFYMRSSALNPEEPFSGETILLDIKNDRDKIIELLEASRKNWAIKYVKKEVTTEEPSLKESKTYAKKSTEIIGIPGEN